MANTLTVANEEQKIILICEMQGQISDGNWENSRPDDHWKVWCDLGPNDIKVGPKIGRNFAAAKDNYNFANKNLLDIVGQRIITKINLVKAGKIKVEKLYKDSWCIPDDARDYKSWVNSTDKYFVDKLNAIKKVKLEDMEAAEKGPYTMKDLIKDCKGLSAAFKARANENALYLSFKEFLNEKKMKDIEKEDEEEDDGSLNKKSIENSDKDKEDLK